MSGLLDPTHLINTFGLIGIMVVLFAEWGLLVGFFLPGDSLLVTAGLLVAGGLVAPRRVVGRRLTVAARAGPRDPREPGRPLARPASRASRVQPTQLAAVQGRVRRSIGGLLRAQRG